MIKDLHRQFCSVQLGCFGSFSKKPVHLQWMKQNEYGMCYIRVVTHKGEPG